MDEDISPRALAYGSAVVSGIKLENVSRTLLEGKSSTLLILLQPIVELVVLWMNQAINLVQRSLITLAGMYGVLGVMFYMHNSGCSPRQVLSTLQIIGGVTPLLPNCRYILSHILAFLARLSTE